MWPFKTKTAEPRKPKYCRHCKHQRLGTVSGLFIAVPYKKFGCAHPTLADVDYSSGDTNLVSQYIHNKNGLCRHWEGIIAPKEKKSYTHHCHWCDKGINIVYNHKIDYRSESTAMFYSCCHDCQTTHEALKKSLDHWIDNCDSFPGKRYLLADLDWFSYHCMSDNCECCRVFGTPVSKHCGKCPLTPNSHSENCCGGLWDEGRLAAKRGTLTLSHLQKIRDYIYLICVREGIVEKPPKTGIIDRLTHTLNCLPMCEYFIPKGKYGCDSETCHKGTGSKKIKVGEPCVHNRGYHVTPMSDG